MWSLLIFWVLQTNPPYYTTALDLEIKIQEVGGFSSESLCNEAVKKIKVQGVTSICVAKQGKESSAPVQKQSDSYSHQRRMNNYLLNSPFGM